MFALFLIFISVSISGSITVIIDSKTRYSCINNATYEFKLTPFIANITKTAKDSTPNTIHVTLPIELMLGANPTCLYSNKLMPTACTSDSVRSITLPIETDVSVGIEYYFTIFPIVNPSYAQNGNNFTIKLKEFDNFPGFSVYGNVTYLPNDLLNYSLAQTVYKVGSKTNLTFQFTIQNAIPVGGYISLQFPFSIITNPNISISINDVASSVSITMGTTQINITSDAIKTGLSPNTNITILVSTVPTPSSISTVSGFFIRTCDNNSYAINMNSNTLFYSANEPCSIIIDTLSIINTTINANTSYELHFSMEQGFDVNGMLKVYFPTEISFNTYIGFTFENLWENFVTGKCTAVPGEYPYIYSSIAYPKDAASLGLKFSGIVNPISTKPTSSYISMKTFDANGNMLCLSKDTSILIVAATPGSLSATAQRLDSSHVGYTTKISLNVQPYNPYSKRAIVTIGFDKSKIVWNSSSTTLNTSIDCIYSDSDTLAIIKCTNSNYWCSSPMCTGNITIGFSNLVNPLYSFNAQDTSYIEIRTFDDQYMTDRMVGIPFTTKVLPAIISNINMLRTDSNIVGKSTSFSINFTLAAQMMKEDIIIITLPSKMLYQENGAEITSLSIPNLCKTTTCPIGDIKQFSISGFNPVNSYMPNPLSVKVTVGSINNDFCQTGYNTNANEFSLASIDLKALTYSFPINMLSGQAFQLKINISQYYTFPQYGIIEVELPIEMSMATKDGNDMSCLYQIDNGMQSTCIINSTSQILVNVSQQTKTDNNIAMTINYARAPTKVKKTSNLVIKTYTYKDSLPYITSYNENISFTPIAPNNLTSVNINRSNSEINDAIFLTYNITIKNPMTSECNLTTTIDKNEVLLSSTLENVYVEVYSSNGTYTKVPRAIAIDDTLQITANPCLNICDFGSQIVFRITGLKNPNVVVFEKNVVLNTFDRDGYAIDTYNTAYIEPPISAGTLTNINISKSSNMVGDNTSITLNFTIENPVSVGFIQITFNNNIILSDPTCSNSSYFISQGSSNQSTTCDITLSEYLTYANDTEYLKKVSQIVCNMKCEGHNGCKSNDTYTLVMNSCFSNMLDSKKTTGSILFKTIGSGALLQVDGGIIDDPYSLLPQLANYTLYVDSLTRTALTPSGQTDLIINFVNKISLIGGAQFVLEISLKEFEKGPTNLQFNTTSWQDIQFTSELSNDKFTLRFKDPCGLVYPRESFCPDNTAYSLKLCGMTNGHANYSKASPYISITVISLDGYYSMGSDYNSILISPLIVPSTIGSLSAILSNYTIGSPSIMTIDMNVSVALYPTDAIIISFPNMLIYNNNAYCQIYNWTSLSFYNVDNCTSDIGYIQTISINLKEGVDINGHLKLQVLAINNSYHYLTNSGVLSLIAVPDDFPNANIFTYSNSYVNMGLVFTTANILSYQATRSNSILSAATNITVSFELATSVRAQSKLIVYISKTSLIIPTSITYTVDNITTQQLLISANDTYYILYFSPTNALCATTVCSPGQYSFVIINCTNPSFSAIKGELLTSIKFSSLDDQEIFLQSESTALGNILSIPGLTDINLTKSGNIVNGNTNVSISMTLIDDINGSSDILISIPKANNIYFTSDTAVYINSTQVSYESTTIGMDLQLLAKDVCSSITCAKGARLLMEIRYAVNPGYIKDIDGIEFYIADGDMNLLKAYIHNTLVFPPGIMKSSNISDFNISRSVTTLGALSNYSMAFVSTFGIFQGYKIVATFDDDYFSSYHFTCNPVCDVSNDDSSHSLTFNVGSLLSQFCIDAEDNCAGSTITLNFTAANPNKIITNIPPASISIIGAGLIESGMAIPNPGLQISQLSDALISKSSNLTGALSMLSIQFILNASLTNDSTIMIQVSGPILYSTLKCYRGFKTKIETSCTYSLSDQYISSISVNYGIASTGDAIQLSFPTKNALDKDAISVSFDIYIFNSTHDLEHGYFVVNFNELSPCLIKNITLGYSTCSNKTNAVCSYDLSFSNTNQLGNTNDTFRVLFTDSIAIMSCNASANNNSLECFADNTTEVWISTTTLVSENSTIQLSLINCTLPPAANIAGNIEISAGILKGADYEYYDIGYYSEAIAITPNNMQNASIVQSSSIPLSSTNLSINFISSFSMPSDTIIQVGIPSESMHPSENISFIANQKALTGTVEPLGNYSMISISGYCALNNCSNKAVSLNINGIGISLFSLKAIPFIICTYKEYYALECMKESIFPNISLTDQLKATISYTTQNYGYKAQMRFNISFPGDGRNLRFNISIPKASSYIFKDVSLMAISLNGTSINNTKFTTIRNDSLIFSTPKLSSEVSYENILTIDLGDVYSLPMEEEISVFELTENNELIGSFSGKVSSPLSEGFDSVAIDASSFLISEESRYKLTLKQHQIIPNNIQYVVGFPSQFNLNSSIASLKINDEDIKCSVSQKDSKTLIVTPELESSILQGNNTIEIKVDKVINPSVNKTYLVQIYGVLNAVYYISTTSMNMQILYKANTDCMPDCNDCFNSTYCKDCKAYILNGKCYSTCPYSFYPLDNTCTACSVLTNITSSKFKNVKIHTNDQIYGCIGTLSLEFDLPSCQCESTLIIQINEKLYRDTVSFLQGNSSLNYSKMNTTTYNLPSLINADNCATTFTISMKGIYAPFVLLSDSADLVHLSIATSTGLELESAAIDLLTIYPSLTSGVFGSVEATLTSYIMSNTADYIISVTTTQIYSESTSLVISFPETYQLKNTTQCSIDIGGSYQIKNNSVEIKDSILKMPRSIIITIKGIQNPGKDGVHLLNVYAYLGNNVTYTKEYTITLNILPEVVITCTNNCQECKNKSYCLICKSGTLQLNGSCLSQCPESYVALSSSCVKCGSNCTECNQLLECAKCNSTFFLNGVSCVEVCPSDKVADFNRKCITPTCKNNCGSCHGDACYTCLQGYYLNNKTKECTLNCSSISAIKNNICYECGVHNDVLTFVNNDSCVEKCPLNSYGDLNTLKCTIIDDSTASSITLTVFAASAMLAGGIVCAVVGGNFIMVSCAILSVVDIITRIFMTVVCVRVKQSAFLFSVHFSSVVFNTFVFVIFLNTTLSEKLKNSNIINRLGKAGKTSLIILQGLFGMNFVRLFYSKFARKPMFEAYYCEDRSFNISLLMHNLYGSLITLMSVLACIYNVATTSTKSALFAMSVLGLCCGLLSIAGQVYEVIASIKSGRYVKLRVKI